MLGKRSHDVMSAPKDGEEHRQVIQVLQKMIQRIQSNKEDLQSILNTPLEPITPALLQREVITEADVQQVMNSLTTIVGDRICNGEVFVDDTKPMERIFKFSVFDPLSITDKEIEILGRLPGIAKTEYNPGSTADEMVVSLTYTKVRKLALLYRQEQNALSKTQVVHPKDFGDKTSLSVILLHSIYQSFDVDEELSKDLNVQTKSDRNDVTDVIFSVYVRGPVNGEKVSVLAVLDIIESVRVYPGCKKGVDRLRIEVRTFNVDKAGLEPMSKANIQ